MAEWWTYSLQDFLLFSPDIYARLIQRYNDGLWPLHLPALIIGGFTAWAAVTARVRLAAFLLAGVWAWVGWSWLAGTYATINWAALYAARAFWTEAVLLLALAFLTGPEQPKRGRCIAGGAVMAVALFLWPLSALLQGWGWGDAAVFGILPDPTALLTIGVLITATHPLRWVLLPIPLIWLLLSTLTLAAMEDGLAPVPVGAALIALVIMGWTGVKSRS